jgi:hypothetical protein
VSLVEERLPVSFEDEDEDEEDYMDEDEEEGEKTLHLIVVTCKSTTTAVMTDVCHIMTRGNKRTTTWMTMKGKARAHCSQCCNR